MIAVLFTVTSIGSLGMVFAEGEDGLLVIDTSNTAMIRDAGVPASSVHTMRRPYSMRWAGADLSRAIRLSGKTDWSQGNYLEFWLYSATKTNMAFDVALISENAATAGADYYRANVSVGAKGWSLVSIAFEEFASVNAPVGFENIDGVELWPTTVDEDAELYFDGMYITQESAEAEEGDTELVLYDLSSAASISEALLDSGLKNISVAAAPGKSGSAALKWTDQPNGAWLRFKNLPVTDMNAYNTMEISLYSAKSSGDTVRFVCASDNDATSGRDYFHSNLMLDWEGEWRTITLRVGDSGNMSNAGVVLGWDQLTGLEFWYNVDDKSKPSEVYIDKITLKNVDYSYLWESEQYADPAPLTDNHYDFAAKINARFPNHQHPRLVATQEDIDYIKREKDNDDYLRRAIPKLLSTCDSYAEMVDTADDTITTSTRAATLALGYALTEDPKYADALWKKMTVLSTECISWEPGSTSALSIGDTARYVGITYDLMYNYWTEEQRRIVRNAIVLYGLEPLRPTVLSGKGLAVQEDNWTAVIFSGVGVAALAIADADGYADTANQFLNRVPNFFQHCFKHYAPDGAGFEGTNYWHYTMLGYLPYEAAMCHSIGEEDYERFTLLNQYGLDKTGYFMLNMVGDTMVDFNFYDGHEHMITSTGDFWLARYFDKPEFGGYLYETGNGEPWAVLLYRPDERYESWRETMDTDYHADGSTQVGAMRTSFVEKNGFYVGYKGGENGSASHGRMDIGSFVLEAMGQRWIRMIGSEDYNAPEMFQHLRYSYYGNRAEGGNTLVIDPAVDQSPDNNLGYPVDQTRDGYCPIITTKSSPTASYAIVDMTDAYRESADSIQRGFGLIADKNAFLVQDEIKLKKGAEVYSFMHTQADVEVSADGKSAIMSQGGKQMKATLLSPKNAKLSVMDAVPLPTSPEAQNLNRNVYKKLTVRTRIEDAATISVLFTPYYGEGNYEYTIDGVVKLSNWDSFLNDPVPVNAIYLDGVLLDGFETGKTMYSVQEERSGTITAEADSDVKLSITQANKVGEFALIEATDKDGNTTMYTIFFSDEPQKALDNWNSYPPKGFIYSANRGQIENVLDGDYSTMWANDGPQYLGFDLGSRKLVHEVQLYWNNNERRSENFDIQVSDDAENWTTVWKGDSVMSNKMEAYSFEPVMARYVKVHGYYNTSNAWTTIVEMRVTSSDSCFDDLDGCWAQSYIEDMAKIGLLEGTGERVFSPEQTLSRAEFLTMLSRTFEMETAAYSGTITDIGESDWYTPYIEAAYKNHLIPEAMLPNNRFEPEKNITREEICALAVSFYEHFEKQAAQTSIDHFTDRAKISGWATSYVEKCMALRFVNGVTETLFDPLSNATRAQAATIIKRIYIKTY